MSAPRLKPAARDQFGSAADFAYARLRDEIMGGMLQPGQRIREQELSERLEISRTPVREALSRLQADGLLELAPRIGLAVAMLDDAAVIELYETREALEGTAAALAARYANPRDIGALRSILTAEANAPPEPGVLQRHNRSFHEAVFNAAHNRFLLKSFQALHDALTLLGPTTLTVADRRATAHAEHRRIVDAIERRDPVAAEAEIRRHVHAGGVVRQAMRSALPRI